MILDHLISEGSLDVLHIIHNKTNLSQRQIANETGFSVGKVNYCLKALIDIGFVKIENFNKSSQKLSYAYILTPKGIKEKAAITKKFINYHKQEYDKLNSYMSK